jgi:hypothetical protein
MLAFHAASVAVLAVRHLTCHWHSCRLCYFIDTITPTTGVWHVLAADIVFNNASWHNTFTATGGVAVLDPNRTGAAFRLTSGECAGTT